MENKTCLTCKFKKPYYEVLICEKIGTCHAITTSDSCEKYERNEDVDERGVAYE